MATCYAINFTHHVTLTIAENICWGKFLAIVFGVSLNAEMLKGHTALSDHFRG